MRNRLNFNYQSYLNQSEVTLCLVNGSWFKMSPYCAYLTKWNSKYINISYNMRKTILQEIRHIKFPFLQELYLFGNNIDSIELIHHIDLPSLSSISLSENEITSLGPMKKVCWKNLKILSIKKAGRKIQNGKELAKLNATRLERLELENSGQFVDLRWIAKIETQFLKKNDLSTQLKQQKQEISEGIIKKYENK